MMGMALDTNGQNANLTWVLGVSEKYANEDVASRKSDFLKYGYYRRWYRCCLF